MNEQPNRFYGMIEFAGAIAVWTITTVFMFFLALELFAPITVARLFAPWEK